MLAAVLPRRMFLEFHSEVRAELLCRPGRLKAGLTNDFAAVKLVRIARTGSLCRTLVPFPVENCTMFRPTFSSWRSRNTMNAGRRCRKSNRPSLEAMEERTLLTLMYANSASVVERDGPGDDAVQDQPDFGRGKCGYCQLLDIELDGDCRHGLHRGCWDLTIAAGQTSGIISVGVLADQAATTNRVFYLSLSGASRATLETPKLSGTIVEENTPPPPSLSIASEQETVGTSGATTTMTFTVSLNEALALPSHSHGDDERPDRQGRHQLPGYVRGPHLCPRFAHRAVRRDDLRFYESRDGLLFGESHRWQRPDWHSAGLRDHRVLRPPLLLPDTCLRFPAPVSSWFLIHHRPASARRTSDSRGSSRGVHWPKATRVGLRQDRFDIHPVEPVASRPSVGVRREKALNSSQGDRGLRRRQYPGARCRGPSGDRSLRDTELMNSGSPRHASYCNRSLAELTRK